MRCIRAVTAEPSPLYSWIAIARVPPGVTNVALTCILAMPVITFDAYQMLIADSGSKHTYKPRS